VPEALKLPSMEEVEKHFRATHKDSIIKPADTLIVAGLTSRSLRSTGLQRLIRQEWEHQKHFPLPIATKLSQQFAQYGLQFFKVNKTVTHVSVARPQFLDIESNPVSDGIKRIVQFINENSKCTRKKLIEALAPTPKQTVIPVVPVATPAAPVAEGETAAAPAPAKPAAPEPTPEPSSGSDLTVEYEIALAQDDLISIEFNVSEYYQGAAHPNSYSEVINYDLKNGRQLKLSDLFKPGSKYLQTLSSYAIADLKKQSKAKGDALVDADIQSGAGPKPENYDKWTITKNGVGIDFGAYQVGPYAAGPWSVVVPYANLKDLINPDGPIAQITK